MTLTPYQILAAARLLVCKQAPYFQAGIFNLVPKETPGFGTFGTSKDWVLYWDPEVTSKWGVDITAGVLVHELLHLLQDHFDRFKDVDNKDIANIAGDLTINPAVAEMGFKLPANGMLPGMFGFDGNLTAEQYYNELKKLKIEYKYTLENGCGSCSGRRIEIEDDNDAKEVGRTDAEKRRVKILIAQAIGQSRGSVPGSIKRWAGAVLAKPKISWREQLARVCRATIAYRPGSDYSTYSKPSRRQAAIGFGPGKPVLSSFRGSQARVVLLVDTSGSMSEDQLRTIMSEAQGILKVTRAAIDMIVCDAAVHGVAKVNSIAEACKLLTGGGGSDFCPAFDEVKKLRPKCNLVIAATDGDISVPEREPAGMRTIWLLVGKHAHKPCSWGTHIHVD